MLPSLQACALQVAAGEGSTQRVTIMRVDEDGAAHREVTGACRELDAALRGCGSCGDSTSLPPACMAHLRALLEMRQQLRNLL